MTGLTLVYLCRDCRQGLMKVVTGKKEIAQWRSYNDTVSPFTHRPCCCNYAYIVHDEQCTVHSAQCIVRRQSPAKVSTGTS